MPGTITTTVDAEEFAARLGTLPREFGLTDTDRVIIWSDGTVMAERDGDITTLAPLLGLRGVADKVADAFPPYLNEVVPEPLDEDAIAYF